MFAAASKSLTAFQSTSSLVKVMQTFLGSIEPSSEQTRLTSIFAGGTAPSQLLSRTITVQVEPHGVQTVALTLGRSDHLPDRWFFQVAVKAERSSGQRWLTKRWRCRS